MLSVIRVIPLLFLSMTSVAESKFEGIMQSSTGLWKGQLYYLDYQSGKRFGIPMQVAAELTPDNATLVRKLTFTDPGVLVHAVNLITKDRDSGELVESYFREGKGQLFRYQMIEQKFDSANNWRYVYQFKDLDDNRPAIIRHTVVRKNKLMTSSKEVQYTDKASEFILRNSTELKLVEQ